MYFIKSDGPRRVMNELMRLLNAPDVQGKLNIVELCVSSIKQLANTKATFKEFLNHSEVNRSLLLQCLKRCFALSDNWHECTNELLRFNKIFHAKETAKQQRVKRLETQAILQIDFKNVESYKALELLENQEDMSIRMAPIVKIRNNIYFTAVGCFKALFEIDFFLDTCDILTRLIDDLQKDSINDYLFQHLVLMIQALHKEPRVLVTLIE